MSEKTFYIPYWQVLVSNGDGSASFLLFSTEKLAEAYVEAESEPFCESVYHPRYVTLDPEPRPHE